MVGNLWEKIIDPEHVFIVAEAGINHNGTLAIARQLVDAAVCAGADAVKFQIFSAECLVTADAPKAAYQIETTDRSESQFDMLRKLELSRYDYQRLYDYCHKKGIIFMATPFDEDSADFLEEMGVGVFKVSSGDITNLSFLTHIARKNKPMIVSTGMSTLAEVETAISQIRNAGAEDIVLLHCVSNYPAQPEEVNLRAMQTMAGVFKVPVGYSDHTLGIDIAVAAAAMGACVIEKHFTLDSNLAGPDHSSSLEPDKLRDLVQSIRKVEAALGDGVKLPAKSEVSTAAVVRKSLVAASEIKAGTVLSKDLIAIKRPGTGFAPSMISSIISRKAKVDIPKGELLSRDMLI